MTASQRIVRVRREYNQWVANQTLEDYALRFTALSSRKWSHGRVATTAVGSISFLALEAIGGLITLNFGFVNAVLAILIVSGLIFATSTVVGYYAAKYGVDIDLLTRGAGFGYIGSTLSSMIYAIFTFIFFAIEAAIMAVALELGFGIPLSFGYAISALIIIPLVTHGITFISKFQAATQVVWSVLQLLPFAAITYYDPGIFRKWSEFAGVSGEGATFHLALFGAAASVVFSLMGQIGEQVDFLRFMPPKKTEGLDWRWWGAMLTGGPSWILVGGAKMLAGSVLAVVALQHGLSLEEAKEPVEMYRVGFSYAAGTGPGVVAITVFFVVLSQIKINVTNAYAGSIAWSNFFARLTHSHPGRVVWLVFNVTISWLLMELGIYRAFGTILAVYSNLAVAWIGALVADLIFNKPLGLSPSGIEFKRAYLHDYNPVGSGAMAIGTVAALASFAGLLGPQIEAFAGFIGLFGAFAATPLLAYATRGKYYLARTPAIVNVPAGGRIKCCICEFDFEPREMAGCPVYDGPICSLCCTLDARCGDRCKPAKREEPGWLAVLPENLRQLIPAWLPRYAKVFLSLASLAGGMTIFAYMQGAIQYPDSKDALKVISWLFFWLAIIVSAISSWMIVLARESRQLAQQESERQTVLLMDEIEAHERTDAALQMTNSELQGAMETAERANLAKSRYMIGISHELRSPLNAVMGYAQILDTDSSIPKRRRDAIRAVRRSSEHMSSLIDGLLDISKIEAGRLYLQREELDLSELLGQMADMFRLQAKTKGLAFHVDVGGDLPKAVWGDGRRLRQIFINLLSNAIKFTNEGSVTFKVRYRNMFAEVEVSDTGVGIPDDDLARIFEPFERVDHPGTPISGTGLGLTITKMLVSVMGGEILVKSAPGVGSTFKARLLLSEVLYPSATAMPFRAISGYEGRRRTILIADDDEDHCAILCEVLGPLGFRLTVAHNGADCLSLAERYQPDIILLDIAMPGLSGWKVAEELRERVSPGSTIMIISGNAFELDQHPGHGSHVDAIVTKPVDVQGLLRGIADKLTIRWMFEVPQESVESADGNTAGAVGPLPEQQVILDLIQLGEIGYVRGIKDKLTDISEQSARYMWLIELLEPMVERLDFPLFMKTLSHLQKQGRDDAQTQ